MKVTNEMVVQANAIAAAFFKLTPQRRADAMGSLSATLPLALGLYGGHVTEIRDGAEDLLAPKFVDMVRAYAQEEEEVVEVEPPSPFSPDLPMVAYCECGECSHEGPNLPSYEHELGGKGRQIRRDHFDRGKHLLLTECDEHRLLVHPVERIIGDDPPPAPF